MLTAAGAIALALVAMRLAARPPAGGYTFGLKRAEILSAQLNGATLLALALFIVYEGVGHGDYLMEEDSPESRETYAELNSFLLQHLQ